MKFDVKQIKPDFMLSKNIVRQVNAAICRLESSLKLTNINEAYDEWCNIITSEIKSKLPHWENRGNDRARKHNKSGKAW